MTRIRMNGARGVTGQADRIKRGRVLSRLPKDSFSLRLLKKVQM